MVNFELNLYYVGAEQGFNRQKKVVVGPTTQVEGYIQPEVPNPNTAGP
jgi:hypothetical protein